MVAERGLFLNTEGPPSQNVDSEPIKIARIAQNLPVNALMHTERGGVIVTWRAENEGPAARWVLCVQDTGPGFASGQVSPIAPRSHARFS